MNSKVMLAIGLLVFFLAISLLAPAAEDSQRPRLISVTGTAEINVPPDEAILRLGVESRDKEVAAAKFQNDARMKKVLAVAHNVGVEEKDVQTSALTMGADYSEEKVPRLLGYDVTQQIQITLKDVSKYEALMTRLLEAGVNQVNGVWFQVHDTRKLRDELRIKAIHAAKEKATSMAGELGQTVGKPWSVSENGDWGMSGMANVVNGSRGGGRDAAEGQSAIAPGQITLRASVNVSFQLE